VTDVLSCQEPPPLLVLLAVSSPIPIIFKELQQYFNTTKGKNLILTLTNNQPLPVNSPPVKAYSSSATGFFFPKLKISASVLSASFMIHPHGDTLG